MNEHLIKPALVDRLISSGHYGVTQIAADTGEGKTTLACSIAASVALGEPTFGGLATCKGVVTIVDFEGIGAMLGLNLTKLLGDKSDALPQNQINIISKDKGQFNVMVPGDRDYIVRQLQRYNTDLCILDSLMWFVADPNNFAQVDVCKSWLKRIQQEVGCSILIMMHTSKNPFGLAYESPYGILGTTLKQWVSSKLGFGRLKGSYGYNILEGLTRQWGKVRHFLHYYEDTNDYVLIDKAEVPWRFLGNDERGVSEDAMRLAEQLQVKAHQNGIKVNDIAHLLQVNRRSFTFWASGERQPTNRNYNAMLDLLNNIRNDPASVKARLR